MLKHLKHLTLAVAVILVSATPASAWLVPSGPAEIWRAEGYGDLLDKVVGENVTQVFSLDQAHSLNLSPGSEVLYDLETGPGFSPPSDTSHPLRSLQAFVTWAHTNGYLAMIAPSRELAWEEPKCNPHTGKAKGRLSDENRMFLACGFLRIPADDFLLQAQHLECDPDQYADLVQHAAAQVRGNLIAELTDGWGNTPCVTMQAIIDSYDAAAPYARHWALWGSRYDAAPLWEHVHG